MEHRKIITVALRFNEKINARDLTGLAELMTEDHTFIDIPGEVHQGRDKIVLGWSDFFKAYPDYRNNFTSVDACNNLVIMIGYSDCSHDSLDGPSIWTARIQDGLVSEWRVYEDTDETRIALGISS
ncbi:MAG: nuclear transport factor 2 family protein [Candidatus Thorarchaeota archaeon]|jgi:ketosteroid isomerase-like protein